MNDYRVLKKSAPRMTLLKFFGELPMHSLGQLLDPLGDGVELDWSGLLAGEGWRWLLKHPDWGWFIDGLHWSHLMRENHLWLEKHGYLDFFKDNGIEYVNATDEVWAWRVADISIVKEAVESRFQPAFTDKL